MKWQDRVFFTVICLILLASIIVGWDSNWDILGAGALIITIAAWINLEVTASALVADDDWYRDQDEVDDSEDEEDDIDYGGWGQ